MNENPLFRVQVINLIENNKSLGIWDHVNVNKLLELLKNKTFAHFELISLYGLLTVFFRDLGFVVPSKLGNYNSKKNQIVLIESKESSKLYTLENTKLLDNDTATRCTCRTGYFKFNNNGVDNCELGMYNSLVYLSYYICRLTMERCQVSTGHKQLK